MAVPRLAASAVALRRAGRSTTEIAHLLNLTVQEVATRLRNPTTADPAPVADPALTALTARVKDVEDEATARNTAASLYPETRWRGPWASNGPGVYAVDDVVFYSGRAYRVIVQHNVTFGNRPTLNNGSVNSAYFEGPLDMPVQPR